MSFVVRETACDECGGSSKSSDLFSGLVLDVTKKASSLESSWSSWSVPGVSRIYVLLYAPWCPACKRAAPIYSKKSEKDGVLMLAIDASENRSVADEVGLRYFPTLMIYDVESQAVAKVEEGVLAFLHSL